jgi:hypothetical protein
MDLQEVGFGRMTGLIWPRIGDRQGALVNVVMNLRVP